MGSNQSNVPVEMIELDYPIRIERYGFVPDSGGAGRLRGGLSIEREYRVLTDRVYFGIRSDKRRFPPHGLEGGGEGQPSNTLINPGPNERRLPTLAVTPTELGAGDVVRHVMAGGGGHGSPLDRDPARVREDLLDGKIGTAHARDAYAVVVSDDGTFAVNEEATALLRAQRRERAGSPEVEGADGATS